MNRESSCRAGLQYRQMKLAQQQHMMHAAQAAAEAHAQQLAAQAEAPQPQRRRAELCRYLWLPIESSKTNRSAMMDCLGPALSFLSQHMSMGRTALIHDSLGQDQCICIAVALLLACYDLDPPASGASSCAAASSANAAPVEGDRAGADLTAAVAVQAAAQPQQPVFVGPFQMHKGKVLLPTGRNVTKHSVRQALAFVSSHCPQARPTRGMLRQVFNFFNSHSDNAERYNARKLAGQSRGPQQQRQPGGRVTL